MTAEVLLLALIAICVITSLLLGSWRTGSTVTTVCALATASVMGIMGFWGISLNAISLVNLVISMGIAVEFCSHIARAFMGAGHGLPYDHPSGSKERDERAYTALVDVGPSVRVADGSHSVAARLVTLQVFSGITMTKLIGISVLAFTRSKLLEVSGLRMPRKSPLTILTSGRSTISECGCLSSLLEPCTVWYCFQLRFHIWVDRDTRWKIPTRTG